MLPVYRAATAGRLLIRKSRLSKMIDQAIPQFRYAKRLTRADVCAQSKIGLQSQHCGRYFACLREIAGRHERGCEKSVSGGVHRVLIEREPSPFESFFV